MGQISAIFQRLVRAGKTEVGIGIVITTTAVALIALTLALILGFNRWVSNTDQLDQAEERELAAKYLDRSVKTLIAQQKVQLTWDDAFRAVGYGSNFKWADTYFGDFLWTNFHTDQLFLVSPQAKLLRAWDKGQPRDFADDSAGYDSIAADVASSLKKMAENGSVYGQPAGVRRLKDTSWPMDAKGRPLTRWSYSLIDFHGQPALATVASILPDTTYSLLTRTPAHVVAIRLLDQEFLSAMGDALLLNDVAFSAQRPFSPGVNDLELTDPHGKRLGWITWHSPPPSSILTGKVKPLFLVYLAFLLAVIGGGWAIVRELQQAMERLRESESKAQYSAMHDAMTGLANRRCFLEKLQLELDDVVRNPAKALIAVAYFDLDHFKTINDTLGHHVGDELVCAVARRARSELPKFDFLARIGGDEFVITRRVGDVSRLSSLIGEDVLKLFNRPFEVAGHVIDVSASCGVSWAPDHGVEAGDLLRRADVALYRAKHRGRARWRAFTPEMLSQLHTRRDLEIDLRVALAEDRLQMVYQPLVDAENGKILGFEALVRWNDPTRGDVRPDVFVQIAEQSGLMTVLGDCVLRWTFAEIAQWQSKFFSINLSPVQIMARGFLENLQAQVEHYHIDPSNVVFEVTEGVLMERSNHVLRVLREIKAMGFRIALDDFGTGFSSLSYLRSFPFDYIKVDKSFVQNIENDVDALAILRAIVSLGLTLNMKVVAEGVETILQRQLVQAAGCQIMQGHLFWQAMAPHQVSELLAGDQTAAALRHVG